MQGRKEERVEGGRERGREWIQVLVIVKLLRLPWTTYIQAFTRKRNKCPSARTALQPLDQLPGFFYVNEKTFSVCLFKPRLFNISYQQRRMHNLIDRNSGRTSCFRHLLARLVHTVARGRGSERISGHVWGKWSKRGLREWIWGHLFLIKCVLELNVM